MNILQEYLLKLIQYIPKNIGALVGMVQTVVEFIRELCMLFARLICPIWPGDLDDIVVSKIHNVADIVHDLLEKLKNWLLGLGFEV